MSATARVVDLEEAAWIAACRRGERDVFRPLVERYQARIYNLALRMLGDRAEAEDVAQDTFLKAYRALERYDVSRPFPSWLYRIAVNGCLDRRRKKSSLVPSELSLLAKETTDSGIEQAELTAAVQACLARLPGDYRAALVLKDIEGLDYETMAEVLGENVGALKTRVVRARARLARAIKKLHPELLSEV